MQVGAGGSRLIGGNHGNLGSYRASVKGLMQVGAG